MKCNMDCFNCKYEDCINDELDIDEINRQDKADKRAKVQEELSSENISYKRKWALQNQDKVNESHRKYYESHKEEHNKRSRDNYRNNKEHYKEYNAKRYQENREVILMKQRLNKDKINERRRNISQEKRDEINRKRRERYAKKKLEVSNELSNEKIEKAI